MLPEYIWIAGRDRSLLKRSFLLSRFAEALLYLTRYHQEVNLFRFPPVKLVS